MIHVQVEKEEERKLIDFPPKLELIPCKPIIFDLALSACNFPNLEERKKPPKTGFFGFFSRN
jgi:hypothetical protein